MTREDIIQAVLKELGSDSQRVRKLVERKYNELKNTLTDEDLLWAIVEAFTN